jgi:hypothetical protein
MSTSANVVVWIYVVTGGAVLVLGTVSVSR